MKFNSGFAYGSKRATGMSPSQRGRPELHPLPVRQQAFFCFCFFGVFSFCFQFHTAGRTNYRREARLPPARLKPDTGVLLQRSDQERQK